MKREKTDYPGVFYREADRIGGRGKEKVFYVVYKKNGKVFEEKAGRQYKDAMTAAKANLIRGELIEGKRQTRQDKRIEKQAVIDKWTFSKLWEQYKENNPGLKGIKQDESRYKNHIAPAFADKEPSELVALDIDRIRISLLKTRKPATVKNILELIRRLMNFGKDKQLCEIPSFEITMPTVDNERTEDLTPEQLDKLLKILREGIIIDEDGNKKLLDTNARMAMMIALFTGMRRSEIFTLQWRDVDFHNGLITIRQPKGGKTQTIPLPDVAREVLSTRATNKNNSPWVFPGRKGKDGIERPLSDASKHFREIRKAAGLPNDFRPMHGLRHTFASGLASSGKVPLYIIQRLLTHKSPAMTQRYAHLTDQALLDASNLFSKNNK